MDSCELLQLDPCDDNSDNMLSSASVSVDGTFFSVDAIVFFFSLVCLFSLHTGFCVGTMALACVVPGSLDFFSAPFMLGLSTRA